MVELAYRFPHRLDDLGMRMAEDGAHLARGEIEDGAPLRVVDVAPLRALDDDRGEFSPIANQMLACARPELLVARRHMTASLATSCLPAHSASGRFRPDGDRP